MADSLLLADGVSFLKLADGASDLLLAGGSGLTLTPADIAAIAAAVIAAMNATPPAVNIKKVNDISVAGSGTTSDPWNPA